MEITAALWLASCAEDGAWDVRDTALLSVSEQQRYRAIQPPLRRRQFLLGRVLLRHMLSRQFDFSLGYWQFVEQAQQAPQLLSAIPHQIAFSIAHSCDQVACLLTTDRIAGCDIEYMGKARNAMEIAALYFDAQDVAVLATLQGAEQTQSFYRLWTQHEARFKAAQGQAPCATALWQNYCLGVALSAPLDVHVQQAAWLDDALVLTPLQLDWTK